MTPPRFRSVAEVAERLGYSVPHVHTLIQEGTIPAETIFRIDRTKRRKVQFFAERIDAWIESRSAAPAAPGTQPAPTQTAEGA